MYKINEKTEEKNEYNTMKIDTNIPICNSILIDENKLLKQVNIVLSERGSIDSRWGYKVPRTFDEIPETTFLKMRVIDQIQQRAVIDREEAIELIADLFESDATHHRFEEYINSLYIEQLRELYKLLEIKYMDLLHALNTGSISLEEFEKKCSIFRNLENNLTGEINERHEQLQKHL